jgi:hypothetical protein
VASSSRNPSEALRPENIRLPPSVPDSDDNSSDGVPPLGRGWQRLRGPRSENPRPSFADAAVPEGRVDGYPAHLSNELTRNVYIDYGIPPLTTEPAEIAEYVEADTAVPPRPMSSLLNANRRFLPFTVIQRDHPHVRTEMTHTMYWNYGIPWEVQDPQVICEYIARGDNPPATLDDDSAGPSTAWSAEQPSAAYLSFPHFQPDQELADTESDDSLYHESFNGDSFFEESLYPASEGNQLLRQRVITSAQSFVGLAASSGSTLAPDGTPCQPDIPPPYEEVQVNTMHGTEPGERTRRFSFPPLQRTDSNGVPQDELNLPFRNATNTLPTATEDETAPQDTRLAIQIPHPRSRSMDSQERRELVQDVRDNPRQFATPTPTSSSSSFLEMPLLSRRARNGASQAHDRSLGERPTQRSRHVSFQGTSPTGESRHARQSNYPPLPIPMDLGRRGRSPPVDPQSVRNIDDNLRQADRNDPSLLLPPPPTLREAHDIRDRTPSPMPTAAEVDNVLQTVRDPSAPPSPTTTSSLSRPIRCVRGRLHSPMPMTPAGARLLRDHDFEANILAPDRRHSDTPPDRRLHPAVPRRPSHPTLALARPSRAHSAPVSRRVALRNRKEKGKGRLPEWLRNVGGCRPDDDKPGPSSPPPGSPGVFYVFDVQTEDEPLRQLLENSAVKSGIQGILEAMDEVRGSSKTSTTRTDDGLGLPGSTNSSQDLSDQDSQKTWSTYCQKTGSDEECKAVDMSSECIDDWDRPSVSLTASTLAALIAPPPEVPMIIVSSHNSSEETIVFSPDASEMVSRWLRDQRRREKRKNRRGMRNSR